MKIRFLIAAAVASVAIPACAGTADDLSVAAQMASRQLSSDAAIGVAGTAPTMADGMATMSGASLDTANNGYPPPVPEPSSWAMLAGGLALVGVAARRRRS